MTTRTRMALADAVRVVHGRRGERDVVISTMGPAREWMALGEPHPLDWVFVPSSMGQATALGLGLALARPDLRVIVLNGDGSMLMNLGSLVTIADQAPANLIVVVCDNEAYEVTGAQPTPGAPDYVALARAAGIASLFRFSDGARWLGAVGDVLAARGPTVVVLDVEVVPGIGGPHSPGPAPERARAFMAALQSLPSLHEPGTFEPGS
jgi:sulfopyruvate decarboxylase subunit beta